MIHIFNKKMIILTIHTNITSKYILHIDSYTSMGLIIFSLIHKINRSRILNKWKRFLLFPKIISLNTIRKAEPSNQTKEMKRSWLSYVLQSVLSTISPTTLQNPFLTQLNFGNVFPQQDPTSVWTKKKSVKAYWYIHHKWYSNQGRGWGYTK